jgi:glycosyltransferase involved in cell wall biosynthesis
MISIIVTFFSRTDYLSASIASVLCQKSCEIELIVVDDGSVPKLSDKSDIAPILSDRRVSIIYQKNRGVGAARNLGLLAARGEYVLFLDSDDLLAPSAIVTLFRALETAQTDLSAGSWSNVADQLGAQEKVICPRPSYKDAYANFVRCGWVTGSVLLANDGKTRFNELRMPWESLEFYLDYLSAPDRTATYVEDVVVHIRQHQTPGRLTHLHNHFEPFGAGSFFVEKKRQLQTRSLLNVERASALDFRIMSSVHSLLCGRRPSEAKLLFDEISWEKLSSYEWLRAGSFAWCARQFGFFVGARGFIAGNRLLGRT